VGSVKEGPLGGLSFCQDPSVLERMRNFCRRGVAVVDGLATQGDAPRLVENRPGTWKARVESARVIEGDGEAEI
jgi:hypothetical protein